MTSATLQTRTFYFTCLIIFVLFLKLQQEYVVAQVRVCGDKEFGYKCRFECNCRQNTSCNVTDGTCPSGCADGFWGSNCQLSNECYYNKYSQYYAGTKSVVDSSKTCNKWSKYPHNYCRPFQRDSKPWCYTGRTWAYCQLNNCQCPPGLFGINCQKECHCKNASEVCRSSTGYCISTCGPGWKGRYCDQGCESGTFGDNCTKTCHCQQVIQCQRTDGQCLQGGCAAGYTGKSCQKECSNGTFGSGCVKKCHCLDNSKCRKTDGMCLDGACKPGYIGKYCQTECDNGTFGPGCVKKCHCLDNSKCRKTDGKCLNNACELGHIGEYCQTACPIGKFGDKCQQICRCQNPSVCNYKDGRCADNKCKYLYMGYNCQKRRLVLLIVIILVPIFICIVIAIGVAIYILKRKSKKISDCDEMKSTDNVSMSQIERLNLAFDENEKEDIYQNSGILVRENILMYIEKNKMEVEPFASEFSKLPQGLVYSHTMGIMEENAKKNRYKTLVPYDYTRVVLLPDEMSTSDYINASYITEEKKYIATQGPIDGTFIDFWRMIWQHKCRTIIMLTDVIENGKLKCAQYWPELNHTESHGKFKIHCVQEKKFMIYTYRLFSISKSSNLSQEEFFIDHFQCTTWPDHDVPEDPIYFIEFRNKVRNMTSSKPPYVVHCSAGVGRTGTYIALDILLTKLWKNSFFDVFQSVKDLRQQRPLMVHRRRQYQFIYEVLAEDVLTGSTEIATELIPTEFRKMLCKDNSSSPLQDQFEKFLLPLNGSNRNSGTSNESIYTNVEKNNDEDNNNDDFLDAKFLDGFTMKDEIILTTQPNEKLTNEFWKFVYQKRCNTIVMFEDLFNSVAAYWPDEKRCPACYGNVTVEFMSITETDTFFLRQFKISSSECNLGDVLLNHIQSKIWLSSHPPSQTEIIDFIQTVSGYIKPHKEILVHCQDGFSKSGLFSLLYVMIQMLKNEHYVSILRLVRRMRKKNINIIEDFRSYEYCWMIANLFLGEFSIYANS